MIGLYGISGSGKSYLLKQLKNDNNFAHKHFTFYDGSLLLEEVVYGGLDAFKKMNDEHQHSAREQALSHAVNECQANAKTGVVAGHYMFWASEDKNNPKRVGTETDWTTYTHIIYLMVDPEIVSTRRTQDKTRGRGNVSAEHLRKWQEAEMKELRSICRDRGILFTTITETLTTVTGRIGERLAMLLSNFQGHDEAANTVAVEQAIDTAIANQDGLKTILLLDADKTLAPQDTGLLFWKETDLLGGSTGCPLTEVFKKGYSYASFRQAMLLYEEKADDFDAICGKVAAKVKMHPQMIEMLKRVGTTPHVDALIVTCGLRRVWELVLEHNDLTYIKVIGGGRISDGYVVTGHLKGAVVDHLHMKKLRVLAFGDSPLDMAMLHKADEAYIVVGDQATRSSSMDNELAKAINNTNGTLSALQILLPPTASPRLTLETLPKATLDSAELNLIFHDHSNPSTRFIHATTKPSAKLLTTPTRDATKQSYSLRKAHSRIGYYLATEYLSAITGLEETRIPHVQGGHTDGHRFRHEKATLIIPLMRGGEPMAFGVSKALPRAAFAHAKTFADVDKKIFEGKRTVVLVDSVINTGKSIVEFVLPLRERYPGVRVVVVAGVVQEDAVVVKKGDGKGETGFAEMLRDDKELWVVALRKSANRYKGKGGTDTGHRLFNTTMLD
jgi:uracil phosphoribosyltransferase/adenylate kinase/phosphoserine phosphatase